MTEFVETLCVTRKQEFQSIVDTYVICSVLAVEVEVVVSLH